MVGCLQYDTMLDVGSFYADTKAELAKLPTLDKRGTDELSNMNEVHCGSNCICYEDGEIYFLTGRNKWEIYQGGDSGSGGGGGGGGEGADWPDGYEDVDIDFHDW